jgi:hypothetical protein
MPGTPSPCRASSRSGRRGWPTSKEQGGGWCGGELCPYSVAFPLLAIKRVLGGGASLLPILLLGKQKSPHLLLS